MKKIIVIIMSAFLACLLCACSSNSSLYGNLSELRDNIYSGSNENYAVNCYTGFREKEFAADGVASSSVKTFNVKVIPAFEYSDAQEFNVTVTIDGVNYGGKLTKHYEKGYLVCSLNIEKNPPKNFDVTVYCDADASTVKVESIVTSEFIDVNEALNVAEKELAETIKNNSEGGAFKGEIHARLLDFNGEYYWYVGLITDSVKNQAVLIDAKDGTVAAKKQYD